MKETRETRERCDDILYYVYARYGTAVHMIQCTVWHATSSGHAMPMGYRQDRGDGGGIAAVLRNGEQLTGRVTNNQITTT